MLGDYLGLYANFGGKMIYPKINSLYKREGHDFEKTGIKPKNGKLLVGEYAKPEFRVIENWLVDEKVDGTNIRITYTTAQYLGGIDRGVQIQGRTDDAQIPPHLLKILQAIFTVEKFQKQFSDCNFVVLFGEGYGPKIQSGGLYRNEPGFILFDAYVGGWWLERGKVKEIADGMGLDTTPLIDLTSKYPEGCKCSVNLIEDYVRSKPNSICANQVRPMEGVVCRSNPLMLFRDGTPIMFKLKVKDFE
jgi:RNA ligase